MRFGSASPAFIMSFAVGFVILAGPAGSPCAASFEHHTAVVHQRSCLLAQAQASGVRHFIAEAARQAFLRLEVQQLAICVKLMVSKLVW